MKSMINRFDNRQSLATQASAAHGAEAPLANSAFRELTGDETSAVSGGLGPFAFFVIMAVARCGLANSRH
jgi:hypothetical protein